MGIVVSRLRIGWHCVALLDGVYFWIPKCMGKYRTLARIGSFWGNGRLGEIPFLCHAFWSVMIMMEMAMFFVVIVVVT